MGVISPGFKLKFLKRGNVMSYDDQYQMTSGELKQWMDKFGLNTQQLADILAVTKTCVSYWLTDRRKMPQTTIKLLKYFDRHPMNIFDF